MKKKMKHICGRRRGGTLKITIYDLNENEKTKQLFYENLRDYETK